MERDYITILKRSLPFKTIFLLAYTELSLLWTCGMIVGIIYAYHLHWHAPEPLQYIFILSMAYILISLVKVLSSYKNYEKKTFINYIMLLGLLISFSSCISYSRTESNIINYEKETSFFHNQEGSYVGIALSDSERISNKEYVDGEQSTIKISISVYGMKANKKGINDMTIPMQGTMTVEGMDTSIHKGDLLLIKGTPKKTTIVEERGRIDLHGRYISSNIVGRMYKGDITTISPDELIEFGYIESTSQRWYRYYLVQLGRVQKEIKNQFQHNLSPIMAVLGESLLLGGNYNEIDPTIMKSFTYTGLIHILSISGSHIALLFALVYSMGRLFNIKKRHAIYIGIILEFLYCVLVGWNPPVVRAGIMGFIMAIGFISGRLYQAKQGITITCTLLLLYDPLLLTDVSFQLSFGATYGLLLWGKPLLLMGPNLPTIVKGPLILCISAQLLVLPFQLYYFHYISILSIIAAVFVAPLLDIAILWVMIIVPVTSIITIPVVWSILEYILQISVFINVNLLHIRGGYWWVGIAPLWVVMIYYSILTTLYVILVLWNHKLPPKIKKYTPVLIGLFMIAALSAMTLFSYIDPNRHNYTIHIIPNKKIIQILVKAPPGKESTLFVEQASFIDNSTFTWPIVNALHSYGLVEDDVTVQKINPKKKWTMLLKNERALYVLCNGQMSEKNLELLVEQNTYIVTKKSQTAHYLRNLNNPNIKGIFYYESQVQGLSIDPGDESIYVVAYEYVPDVVL